MKAGGSEVRKGFGEKQQQGRGEAGLLLLSGNIVRKKWAMAGLLSAHWRVRRKGALGTGPTVASLGSLRV